jgi:hypothetical protein
MKKLRNIAIAGNSIFILWIIWNGIDEGARNVGRVEILALTSLLLLLALNIYILLKNK